MQNVVKIDEQASNEFISSDDDAEISDAFPSLNANEDSSLRNAKMYQNLENHVEKAKDKEVEINDGFPPLNTSHKDSADEDSLLRKARMYQDYMKQVPIPKCRSSLIPFTTWVGLGISIKQLYGQPLHYLTNALLHRWDQSRLGTDAEDQVLDTIIHPSKAEATIWLVEELHRLSSSHLHIAHLWQSDPMYHTFVDPIFPKL